MITRFAPSPTGYLHLGHAYAALTVFDAARAADGLMLLRIEDIDTGRCRPQYDAAILEDLAWLGVSWPEPVRRQSHHMADYAEALEKLIAMGVMYRCFKTRKAMAQASAHAPHAATQIIESGPSADEAALLAQGQSFAWRLSMKQARSALGARFDGLRFTSDGQSITADPARFGDVILARKDVPTSYHLASVFDDAHQGVTHVIRGDDLKDAAHLHVLLQALLQLPTPTYQHHRLLAGADGKRLSKRDGAIALRALRNAGETPQSIRARIFG